MAAPEKMVSRGGMSKWLFQPACSGHTCLCSWHTSMEEDQEKAVAGNIVTIRPIYLALIALRKKETLGRLIILAAPRFVTSVVREACTCM